MVAAEIDCFELIIDWLAAGKSYDGKFPVPEDGWPWYTDNVIHKPLEDGSGKGRFHYLEEKLKPLVRALGFRFYDPVEDDSRGAETDSATQPVVQVLVGDCNLTLENAEEAVQPMQSVD